MEDDSREALVVPSPHHALNDDLSRSASVVTAVADVTADSSATNGVNGDYRGFAASLEDDIAAAVEQESNSTSSKSNSTQTENQRLQLKREQQPPRSESLVDQIVSEVR